MSGPSRCAGASRPRRPASSSIDSTPHSRSGGLLDRVAFSAYLNGVCSAIMSCLVCAALGWYVEGWDQIVLGIGLFFTAAAGAVGGIVSGTVLGGSERTCGWTRLGTVTIGLAVSCGIVGTAMGIFFYECIEEN